MKKSIPKPKKFSGDTVAVIKELRTTLKRDWNPFMLGSKAPKRKTAAEITLMEQLADEKTSLKTIRALAPDTLSDFDDLHDSRDFGESTYSISSSIRLKDDDLAGGNS